MLRIPGLGPKKAAALFRDLEITTLEQLQEACREGRVRELDGFGEKTEQTILKGIDIAAAAGKRKLWYQVDQLVQRLRERLRACHAVHQLEFAGSFRRGKETVGDLDILVTSDDPAAVMDHLAGWTEPDSVIARGPTKMSLRLDDGFQIDLRVVPEESFGAALQYFTGSKDHNVVLRTMAKARGLKINEWGLFRVDGDKEERIGGEREKEIYAALDLPLFPPELREARREFEWAAAGELPRLIDREDLRGDLHMHTVATDGEGTIQEMIAAARSRGLQYIAITDHSKRVAMVNGLDTDRLRAQWKQIDRLQRELDDFTLLKGIECDILEDGQLDLPDDVLAEADWVTVSIHFGQNQSRQQITDRICGALAHPAVSSLSHPTGRLLNKRRAYDVDMEAVMKTAAEHGKLLELNAHPARLDLDDVNCAAAKSMGIPVVINSDAHSPRGLDVLPYGVLQARRGGLTSADVANTRAWPELQRLLGKPAVAGQTKRKRDSK